MIRGDEKDLLYNKGEDEDPEIADLLSRTVEILKSDTDHSVSLTANIRSLHHAIRTEKKISELKTEVDHIKQIIKSRVGAIETKLKKSEEIRKEDSPEEKEKFLLKRAM
ncbi:MAG: hypothetical protein SWH54_09785 [Thermodesulfobacteriota bacterium]|nr:hypothetical protein [Thermodesulfobacteriota bacterium]